ncbi:VIT1/CCC1 transporter family protein [Treponema brennaborense]|uniref:Uncharacterized protein n=1 Tax=Treponema brennaborense (strain DSM 12168 / CIP 105900 / DD5/3) TaxID=906968 RepID=F4LMM5_TREBD|nr:VIT1/CCC1 transporter family protein [Treponema brennaborense]AEE16772.1 protein of unknown function DUF125 transmembrane [Treponema brennaborense DSM 12168]
MKTQAGQLKPSTLKFLTAMQINEETESVIYGNVARTVKDEHNRNVLLKIAAEEKKHADIWARITGKTVKPQKGKIFRYTVLSKLFGFTFALKLMEKGENGASGKYESIKDEVPEALSIAAEEDRHERELIDILDEERLQYVGSMVLGLSDALVELTGTLAGLTFALQNNRLVALSGLITGISATLSMTSSEYLSARSEGHKNPLKSSLYTGIVYLVTVACLVLPYLVLPADAFVPAIVILLTVVVLIILGFTYYISVAKDLPFGRRFGEMAGISLSVAAVSFGIGLLVKQFLGIDV